MENSGNSKVNAGVLPYVADLFSWPGISWIIAFLVGMWGVMIGVGKFGLSELLFLLGGAMVLVKIAFEIRQDRSWRRITIGIVISLLIVTIEYGAIRWTNNLAVEAAAQQTRLTQLDQIPGLTEQLSQLKQQDAIADATHQQELSDIGKANDALKSSIEKKDAALASIAKDQYRLNFVPAVYVAVTGTTNDQVLVVNNGKYNVNMDEIDVEGLHQDTGNAPALIPQGQAVTFKLDQPVKDYIASRPVGGNADRLPVECEVRLETMDKKKYSLKFTWFFTIQDGSITKSEVLDRPIDEIMKP